MVPDPYAKPSPLQPTDPILDGAVALSFLAGMTERIRLATGIVILPQRNPLVLAKQLASLDAVSGGRLIFGLGVGYLEPEMTAIGVPMERRGARTDEYLAAMRALWEEEKPAFDGEYVSFSGVNAYPRPVQRPLPVVVGGSTSAAYRRAAGSADGWYGFSLDLEEPRSTWTGCARSSPRCPGRRGDFEITVTPAGLIDESAVDAYAELGVDRLVLIPPFAKGPDAVESYMRARAPERLGATPAPA